LPESGELPGSYSQDDAQALAEQSVFKWYRVAIGSGTAPLVVPPEKGPGHVRVVRHKQLTLLPVRNVVTTDELGREAQAPAVCFGRYTSPSGIYLGKTYEATYEETTETTEVRIPFSIDARNCLVKFNDYVYAIRDDETIKPAALVLECAAELADPETMAPIRYHRILPFGSAGLAGQPAYFLNDDVRFYVTCIYDADGGQLLRTETNAKSVDPRADYYLAGEARRYTPASAGDRTLPGIVPIFCDGAIRQVTWSVGGGSPNNPQTRVSRNDEHALYLPDYRGRRQQEEVNLDELRRRAQRYAGIRRRFREQETT
jgi:hypothetical protein